MKKSTHSGTPPRIVDPDAMKKLSQSAIGVGKLAHFIVGSMSRTAQAASELAVTLKGESGLLFDTEIRDGSSNPKTWPDAFSLSRKAVAVTSTTYTMDGGQQNASTSNLLAENSPGSYLATIPESPKQMPESKNNQLSRNLTTNSNDTNPVHGMKFNQSDQLKNVRLQPSPTVNPANCSALLLGSSTPLKINVDEKIEEELRLLDELTALWKKSTAEYFHSLRVAEKNQAEALRDGHHRKVPPKRVPFAGPKHQRRSNQAKRNRRP